MKNETKYEVDIDGQKTKVAISPALDDEEACRLTHFVEICETHEDFLKIGEVVSRLFGRTFRIKIEWHKSRETRRRNAA